MAKRNLLFVFLITVGLVDAVDFAVAQQGRHSEFRVPAKLRPRVDFWIDIFARYGKHQVVIHHRNFPQAVFGVLDMRAEGARLSEVRFENHKKEALKRELARYNAIFKHLAAGGAPRNETEKVVEARMRMVPGRVPQKYQEVLKNDLVRGQTGIQERFLDALVRSGRYMHVIEDIFVREEGLPIELTRLPFVESSFDYTAYSSAGAAGIWQFMPATGRMFMRIDNVIDERRDPILASRAAARYLKSHYRQLKSWPLAVTAYNHGAAGVTRRTRTFGTTDIIALVEHPTERPFGFASSNFWPELLAALDVYDHYQRYFPGVSMEPALHMAEVSLRRPASPRFLAERAGMTIEELRRYNYAPTKHVWEGRYHLPQGYRLRLPVDRSAAVANLHEPDPTTLVQASTIYGGMQYTVRPGDTLSGIARRYKTSTKKIIELNKLSSDLVRVGQMLVIEQAEHPSVVKRVDGHTPGTHKVQRGDTLYRLAHKFNVSIDQIKRTNRLTSDRLRIGQLLKIPGAVRAPAARESKGSTVASVATYYKVRPGDTLSAIAKTHRTTVANLKTRNKLSSDHLRVGQSIVIGSGGVMRKGVSSVADKPRQYRVKSGDSLWSISRGQKVSVAALRSANRLKGDKLHPGQLLVIP